MLRPRPLAWSAGGVCLSATVASLPQGGAIGMLVLMLAGAGSTRTIRAEDRRLVLVCDGTLAEGEVVALATDGRTDWSAALRPVPWSEIDGRRPLVGAPPLGEIPRVAPQPEQKATGPGA